VSRGRVSSSALCLIWLRAWPLKYKFSKPCVYVGRITIAGFVSQHCFFLNWRTSVCLVSLFEAQPNIHLWLSWRFARFQPRLKATPHCAWNNGLVLCNRVSDICCGSACRSLFSCRRPFSACTGMLDGFINHISYAKIKIMYHRVMLLSTKACTDLRTQLRIMFWARCVQQTRHGCGYFCFRVDAVLWEKLLRFCFPLLTPNWTSWNNASLLIFFRFVSLIDINEGRLGFAQLSICSICNAR